MSVKLEDIARETGFSISTVSRVLSHSNYPVSDSIRQGRQMQEVADQRRHLQTRIAFVDASGRRAQGVRVDGAELSALA